MMNDNNTIYDRLSSLPDDLIHKILSFVKIKDAIKTSSLSSRWRNIWTSMPYLNFSGKDTLEHSSIFVSRVLDHRNGRIGLSSVYLSFYRINLILVERTLSYAFCHNVQQLTLDQNFHWNESIFPVTLLSSKSLKDLTLRGIFLGELVMSPSTWELLALTTLHLDNVTFVNESNVKFIDLFPKSVNLKNLTLNHCKIKGSTSFRICHPHLSNLAIVDREGEIFKDDHSIKFSTVALHSLEKFDLCIEIPHYRNANTIFGLLQQLHDVKFLKLNLELVMVLSWSRSCGRNSYPPCPFANLKTLKIYPLYLRIGATNYLSSKMKNYLLDRSPNASLTLIEHEEGEKDMHMTIQLQVEMQRGSMEDQIRTCLTRIKRCLGYLGVCLLSN